MWHKRAQSTSLPQGHNTNENMLTASNRASQTEQENKISQEHGHCPDSLFSVPIAVSPCIGRMDSLQIWFETNDATQYQGDLRTFITHTMKLSVENRVGLPTDPRMRQQGKEVGLGFYGG